MKKYKSILRTLAVIALVFASSCGTQKKTTKPGKSDYPCNPVMSWTTTLSDSCNFTFEILKTVKFYLSQSIVIKRPVNSTNATVGEDGAIIIVDSIGNKLRKFNYKNSEGFIKSLPQNDPGEKWAKTYYVQFTNTYTQVTHTFQFDRFGRTYVLNKAAKATYRNETYNIEVTTDNSDGNTGQAALLACVQRKVVNVDDSQ